MLRSLSTPKVTEVVKPYDFRIFYIGLLGCVQLFRRADIAQRGTFGETQSRTGKKIRRVLRLEERSERLEIVVHVPVDIRKYSNKISPEEGAHQHGQLERMKI